MIDIELFNSKYLYRDPPKGYGLIGGYLIYGASQMPGILVMTDIAACTVLALWRSA